MISHDGSFESFFTALLEALAKGEEFTGISEGLFSSHTVCVNPQQVEDWFHHLRSQYGEEIVKDFMALFFSNSSQKEYLALRYTQLLQQYGSSIRGALQNSVIQKVMRIRRSYFLEVHRFQGLVRFREIRQWLYGPLTPTHHILPYLWPHFRRRLSQERWILHDTLRDVAVLYDGQIRWANGFVLESDEQSIESKEREIQELWKSFYKSITIPERKNPRQQRQMMPKKYWKYLIEKEENIS